MNGGSASSSTGKTGPKQIPAPGSVYRFGFDVVYEQMKKERNLLEVVVGRLGGGESMMVLYSMTLINSLLSHATPAHWIDLTSALERLNTSRAVIRLMSSHTIEDLTNSILDYQGNIVRVIYFKKMRRVQVSDRYGVDDDYGDGGYAGDGEQEAILDYVWNCANLEVDEESSGYLNGHGVGDGSSKSRGKASAKDMVKWRKLGFETEDLRKEFDKTGMLGLECLVCELISIFCWMLTPLDRNTLPRRIQHDSRSWFSNRIAVLPNEGVPLGEHPTKWLKSSLITGAYSLLAIQPQRRFNLSSSAFIESTPWLCISS